MSDKKKNLDTFIKLLKKKNIKCKEVISFIKDHAIDLNEYDKYGYNSLHYGIKSEKPEIVKVLLYLDNNDENFSAIKADPNKPTKDESNKIFTSPLFLSLLNANDNSTSYQIIQYLIQAGANLDYRDEEGSTLFLHSCEKGRTDIIKLLINNIKKENENKEECEEKIKKLINDSSKNGGGLHYAIIGQQDDVIELLLEYKIDLNICNSQCDNALEYALKEKQMNYFKLILDYITNNKEMNNEDKKKILNHQNKDGNTILHELALCQSSFILNLVLKLPGEFGVDPELKNKEGFDYKQVAENVIESERKRVEDEKKIKEERRRLKEELKQKVYDEEKKKYDEKRKYEEKLRKQEEFGQILIQHRGAIFLAFLFVFLVLMYFMIKNASVKKEIII